MNMDNTSGRIWARVTLIATLTISVVANVTHAWLAESVIHLGLRIPAAAVWPVLSFLAIEIIVRIVWRSTLTHYLARAFVLGPAIPAVIVSYEHQHALLIMMGEGALVSAIGPLAIDGLMIGCTLALLFTRESAASVIAIDALSSTGQVEQPQELELEPVPAEAEVLPGVGQGEQPQELEPAPEIEATPRRARGASSPATYAAIAALRDGANTAQAAEVSGLSAPAVRKYAAVIRTLRQDPRAAIDARKIGVRSDAVDAIREWARLESVR